MPYELTFTKPLPIADTEQYINDCCYGGDVVSDQLLPMISARYSEVQANQEDWGWFIWFADGAVQLAVDIYCDDFTTGAFKVHLTSRRKRFLLPSKIADSPELAALRKLVVARLAEWVGTEPSVELLDENYMPKGV